VGNITAGLDLIRRAEGGSAHALTVPLLTKADGSKFGKTAGGAVWIDPEMTSPYAFFQYWLNSDDKDVIKFLKVFSFKSREEIETLEKLHSENPGAREAHRELARELTSLVHSPEIALRVENAARALFGQGDLTELDQATLSAALAELPRTEVKSDEEFPTWVDLLAATGVVDSKSAADVSLKRVAHISIMRRFQVKISASKNRTFYAVNMQFYVKAKETWRPSNLFRSSKKPQNPHFLRIEVGIFSCLT
jgi:tyrosyl-tRNA synthetase